jgi:hypothetical protein
MYSRPSQNFFAFVQLVLKIRWWSFVGMVGISKYNENVLTLHIHYHCSNYDSA